MRHLFIINPAAQKIDSKRKVLDQMQKEIEVVCQLRPELKYDIHITERRNDAVSYIKHYVDSVRAGGNETIRVHSMGGSGTLLEVVNGVAGLPDMEVAAHPYGRSNSFVCYFSNHKIFTSLGHQILNEAFPMDAIRCGDTYGISFCLVGLEAYASRTDVAWVEKELPTDFSYLIAGIGRILRKNRSQHYDIQIDGEKMSGKIVSIMIANTPSYGKGLHPCVEAHPNDGKLEVCILKEMSTALQLATVLPYLYGRCPRSLKTDRFLKRCSARKIKISSDEEMYCTIDGECFSSTSVEFEILPGAIKFVLPNQVNLEKLPRIYKRPRYGLRG